MPDADPLEGDTPYEVLGVTETDTLDTIEQQKEKIFLKYRKKKRDARQADNNDQFKEANAAIQNIQEAWKEIENNHEPPVADQPVSVEILTDHPVVDSPVRIRVTGTNGPIETLVNASRDSTELASQHTNPDGTAEFTFSKWGAVQFTVPTTDAYDHGTDAVTVDRREVALGFDSPPKTVEIDTEVEFRVTAEGSAEPGVTVGTGSTTLGKTRQNGVVAHTFRSVDEYTVTGEKSDDDRNTYTPCQTTVEVTPKTVDMDVTIEESDPQIGNEITIHVNETGTGRPIENVDVTVGDNSTTTNAKGKTPVTLDDLGQVTVSASKPQEDDRTYTDAATQIQVKKRQRGLRIDSIDGKRMAQSELTVTVVDENDDELEGVSVTTDWGHDETTNEDGEATILLNNKGSIKIVAQKETDEVDYGKDDWIEQIDEYSRKIEIEQAPSIADPGETIEIFVTDEAGNPVNGAEVTCDKQIGESWTTGSNGKAKLPLKNQVGNRRITVSLTTDGSDSQDTTTVRVL